MKDFKPKSTPVKSGKWTVFLGLCKGCGICLVDCPTKALYYGQKTGIYNTPSPEVLPDKCILCSICEKCCPDIALKVEKNA